MFVCVCAFAALISKLQLCVHSMNTPLLPFPSLSASQLNEVNKLKRLLPSPTPSLLSCFLLHLCLSTSTALCTPEPALPSPLSLPPSFISAETLSSSFPHLFFYCHCCRAKALGFPPSISQDRAAITAQERRRPAVRGTGEQ